MKVRDWMDERQMRDDVASAQKLDQTQEDYTTDAPTGLQQDTASRGDWSGFQLSPPPTDGGLQGFRQNDTGFGPTPGAPQFQSTAPDTSPYGLQPAATMQQQKTRYSLGGLTQDSPFTQEQINAARINAKADAMDRWKPGSGLQLRRDNEQLTAAQNQNAEFKRLAGIREKEQGILDIHRRAMAGDVDAQNSMIDAVGPIITSMKDSKGNHLFSGALGKDADGNRYYTTADGAVVPITAQEIMSKIGELSPGQNPFDTIAQHQLGSLSPEHFDRLQTWQRQNRQDADTKDYRDRSIGVQEQNARTQEQHRKDQAEYLKEKLRLERAQHSAASKGSWTMGAVTDDGQLMMVDRTTGMTKFTKPMNPDGTPYSLEQLNFMRRMYPGGSGQGDEWEQLVERNVPTPDGGSVKERVPRRLAFPEEYRRAKNLDVPPPLGGGLQPKTSSQPASTSRDDWRDSQEREIANTDAVQRYAAARNERDALMATLRQTRDPSQVRQIQAQLYDLNRLLVGH